LNIVSSDVFITTVAVADIGIQNHHLPQTNSPPPQNFPGKFVSHGLDIELQFVTFDLETLKHAEMDGRHLINDALRQGKEVRIDTTLTVDGVPFPFSMMIPAVDYSAEENKERPVNTYEKVESVILNSIKMGFASFGRKSKPSEP
jgi:hypothetical protein